MSMQDEYDNCCNGNNSFENHNFVNGQCSKCGILEDSFGYYEIMDRIDDIQTSIMSIKTIVTERQKRLLNHTRNDAGKK